MTRERREEVLIIALVCSVAVHVGLMLTVRSQVMTRAATQTKRSERTVPMRVVRAAERPDPVKIGEILDLKAMKEAPAAGADAVVPAAEAPSAAMASAVRVPEMEMSDSVAPVVATPVFDAKPVGLDSSSAVVVPMTRIETPQAQGTDELSAPSFSVSVMSAANAVQPSVAEVVPALGKDPGSVFLPTKITSQAEDSARGPYIPFTPAKEIYEKVDEQTVAEEKAAVRELVHSEQAADLAKVMDVSLKSALSGQWRYFRVSLTPRPELKTVSKDVVLIIDGSGSIGNDRLSSCRSAARRILRTSTNSGDRFNLVVFRNAYSYAFRTWRNCDAESFEAGEKWLGNQTAHGRTDVFGTISSVLTLPRDPKRPLIALVVTDGDANFGVSDTAEILSKFTALNDGLVSVYMYGVKATANRELIDLLTHANRGESLIFDGWRWSAGNGIDALSERFRDPVLSDLQVIFATGTQAESYPRLLKNVYRGCSLSFVGRVPATAKSVAFSLKGINGANAYEGFFRLPFDGSTVDDASIADEWKAEAEIDRKLGLK